MSLRSSTSIGTRASAIMAAAALIQLAACQNKEAPTGQVVAVVNGSEITTSELQAEAEATRADMRKPGIKNQLLDAVIKRHLQAAAAVERGLDKHPRFLAQKRRAEQQVLAQLYLMNAGAGAGDVDIREARRFILQNPALFEERERLVLDRIGFSPASALSKAEVESVKSLADAERLLQRKGVRYDRQSAAVDPADVPTELAPRLIDARAGQVLYAPRGGGAMFLAIVERKPDPVPVTEQLARAKAILRRQKRQEALQSAVVSLRKSAKIRYQQGYGPAGDAPKARSGDGVVKDTAP
jgi:EpsD family peptidyl-prolyl cis-trans isomerase